ncbi:PREDICTED: uncharacterized protein LOC105961722 [Erythranthe guttata]|uniref:uncharacterized protein LOC105961722 n=1 Tax=Erythranthe guttata TaxID=4155 RepID=UPI00064DA236|nr:PREDICTED: uncharacterized protein LOC105961722 [Erythranthe guttata]|eukprot:XP_012841430.1 PREDICTED: uncharacterized protein LOC105961722 [Erythranthe guttata]
MALWDFLNLYYSRAKKMSFWNFLNYWYGQAKTMSFWNFLNYWHRQAKRMSDTYKDVEFNLEVVTGEHDQVLFLEAGSDFADVLISFLTLPLGTIVRVLNQHYCGDDDKEAPPTIGSLTSLYNGLENLDSCHFWTESCKEMLLNPRSSFEGECLKLKLDINGTTRPTKYFCCEDFDCVYPRHSNISMHRDAATCTCGKSLKREIGTMDSSSDGDGGIFTVKNGSFLISGDMVLVPNINVAGSVMETLSNLAITDNDGTEQWKMTFGVNDIVIMLEDLLIPETESAAIETEPGNLFHEADSNSKKMNLRLTVQKSTNKLLFAQSEEDFVDFLFSLLTVPLGGVAFLLGGNTSLTKLDNLYQSVENINEDKYLSNPDIKNRLINPKLRNGYMSKNQILPLTEENGPRMYYNLDLNLGKEWLSYSGRDPVIEFRNGHRHGSYLKEPTMYMVSDDLIVTPLTMTSSLSILTELKIPLSDVEEVEVQIGLKEGLSILKASLTSTTALTDGLMVDSMFKKQPKQVD